MRICGATVFVDHVSNYIHVALMRDLALEKTQLAKTYFERIVNDGEVAIKAYRADNGRFADKDFMMQCKIAIKPSHYVQLKVIIKMALLKEISTNSP